MVITALGEFIEELSNESGCADFEAGAFSVAGDLSSATLSMTIPVQQFDEIHFTCACD